METVALIEEIIGLVEKAPAIYAEINNAFVGPDPVAALTALKARIEAENYKNLVPHTDLTDEQLNS